MSTSPHPEQFADLSMTGNVTMAGFFMHSGNEWTTIYIYTLNISNDTNTWWVPLNQELDKNMIPPHYNNFRVSPSVIEIFKTKRKGVVPMELRFPIFVKKKDKLHLSCTFSQDKGTVHVHLHRRLKRQKG